MPRRPRPGFLGVSGFFEGIFVRVCSRKAGEGPSVGLLLLPLLLLLLLLRVSMGEVGRGRGIREVVVVAVVEIVEEDVPGGELMGLWPACIRPSLPIPAEPRDDPMEGGCGGCRVVGAILERRGGDGAFDLYYKFRSRHGENEMRGAVWVRPSVAVSTWWSKYVENLVWYVCSQ